MKIKTAELTGAALDWAVAKIETLTQNARGFGVRDKKPMVMDGLWQQAGYSWDWSQGGPIIEREHINLSAYQLPEPGWQAFPNFGRSDWYGDGPTPLTAAMRCYVASKLGGEVDVPDELLKS